MNLMFKISLWKYLLNKVKGIKICGNGTTVETLKNDEHQHYPTSIDTTVDTHFKDYILYEHDLIS